MYFYIIVSTLLVQIYGAPIDSEPKSVELPQGYVQPTPPYEPQLPAIGVSHGSELSVGYPTPPPQPHYEQPTTPAYHAVEPEHKETAYEVTPPPQPAYEVSHPPTYETPKPTYEAKPYTDCNPCCNPCKIPVITVIEEHPKGELAIDGKKILEGGKLLSEAITAKIVAPVVIYNSKVAAAAGALPPLLAAKGAVIGTAIATPIQIGALASSGIVSGVTNKMVAVPISFAAGTLAQAVGAAEKGRQIWNFNIEHGGEILKDGFIRMGHIILKPIAVVVGAQTALNGVGLGIAGTGIKGVGVGIETVGAKMLATGLAAKGLGTTLIKSQFL